MQCTVTAVLHTAHHKKGHAVQGDHARSIRMAHRGSCTGVGEQAFACGSKWAHGCLEHGSEREWARTQLTVGFIWARGSNVCEWMQVRCAVRCESGQLHGCMSRTEIESNTDRILAHSYPYLFYLTNTNIDMDIIWLKKFIFIFVLNGYEYNLDTKSMDIIMDIT